MKHILILALLITTSFAQSIKYPYKMDLKKDLIIGGTTALALTGTFLLPDKEHNESADYFNKLDREEVNVFDRSTTKKWNPDADALRENLGTAGLWGIGLGGALGLTAYQSISQKSGMATNLLTTTLMFFEGGFLVLSLSDYAKAFVDRDRPYAYNNNVTYKEKTEGEDYKESFFSGSAAITSYGVFFTAKLIHDVNPKSNLKYLGLAVATGYAGYTAWLATDAGHHFPTDALVGTAIGAGIAILIPELHKSVKLSDNHHSELSLAPLYNGLNVNVTF